MIVLIATEVTASRSLVACADPIWNGTTTLCPRTQHFPAHKWTASRTQPSNWTTCQAACNRG